MASAPTRFRSAALGLLIVCALTTAGSAQLTPVRLRLDWVWQAPQSIWTLAHERGYFKEEGLDVTIDRGYGGPDTTGSVASGAYDIGFTDINNMVEFNAKNPDHRLHAFWLSTTRRWRPSSRAKAMASTRRRISRAV